MTEDQIVAVTAILQSIFHTAHALAELHGLPELFALAYLAEHATEKLEA